MKEPYKWNYSIKIKTKEGTYEYEEENALEAVKLVERHPDYEAFYMQQNKPKALVKRRANDTKRSSGTATKTR